MDLQNRIDYGHWEPGDSSNSRQESKNVNAWSKEQNVKREILQDSKDSKPTSIKVYMKGILKKSLITSVPEITTTKSWTKKIIKILVFVLCFTGFIYQTLEFLQLYLSYPTVFSILVSNPFRIIQPAITICNRNRLRRSALCENRVFSCFYVSQEKLCIKYPKYCVSDGRKPFTGIIPWEANRRDNFTWHLASIAAHNDSMILDCYKIIGKKKKNCRKPYQRVPTLTANGWSNFCYSLDSLWSKPDRELQMYPNNFNFNLKLDAQPEEYILRTQHISIQIALHDRRRLVNPFLEGYTLRGGMKYEATVSMKEKKLLPAPYDTNCTDYLKLWRENNGTGPMNDLCIEYCKLNSLLKEGKCIDKYVAYPNMEEMCANGVFTTTNEISENCMNSCRRPCHDYSYHVKFEEVGTYDESCNIDWCKLNNIQVKIYFHQLQLTTTQYQPKFERVELFSYIGGYMGMWLGLSLVAIFDFLETLLHIVYFPIGRWRQRTRRRKISHTFKRDEAGDWRPKVY